MKELSNTQIIDRLVDAQGQFQAAAANAMQAAFAIGDILIELKSVTPHGKFEDALKSDTRVVFGIKHAQRFMKIAANKDLVIAHSGAEPLSIREMDRLLTKPKQPPALAAPALANASDDEIIDRLMIKPLPSLGRVSDDAIDAEFTVVAPQPAPAPNTGTSDDPIEPSAEDDDLERYDQDSDWEPDPEDNQPEEDLQAELKRVKADNALMKSIFDDDDHIAAAVRESKTLKTINEALQSRIDILVAENSSLVGKLNYWEARYKKLEKAHAK